MFWKKKQTEPLTEQEEKIKQFRKKELKTPSILFFFILFYSILGIFAYNTGYLTAGTLLVGSIPLWGSVILLHLISYSKITRYTIKVYFDSLKPIVEQCSD